MVVVEGVVGVGGVGVMGVGRVGGGVGKMGVRGVRVGVGMVEGVRMGVGVGVGGLVNVVIDKVVGAVVVVRERAGVSRASGAVVQVLLQVLFVAAVAVVVCHEYEGVGVGVVCLELVVGVESVAVEKVVAEQVARGISLLALLGLGVLLLAARIDDAVHLVHESVVRRRSHALLSRRG